MLGSVLLVDQVVVQLVRPIGDGILAVNLDDAVGEASLGSQASDGLYHGQDGDVLLFLSQLV